MIEPAGRDACRYVGNNWRTPAWLSTSARQRADHTPDPTKTRRAPAKTSRISEPDVRAEDQRRRHPVDRLRPATGIFGLTIVVVREIVDVEVHVVPLRDRVEHLDVHRRARGRIDLP